MAEQLRLVVTSRDRQLLDLACAAVTVPGREGDLGVLPGHAPLIATVRPGVLAYSGRSSGRVAVSSGFCQVYEDRVTVLIDRAWLPEEADAAAALDECKRLGAGIEKALPEELEELRDRIGEARARAEIGR